MKRINRITFNNMGESRLRTENPVIDLSRLAVTPSFKTFVFKIFLNGNPCRALYDPGCTGMVLSPLFISKHLSLTSLPAKEKSSAVLADGSKIKVDAICKDIVVEAGNCD